MKTINDVYRERNSLAAVLAHMFPSYLKIDNVQWPIIYIDLPTGQISFHIPILEIMQFLPLQLSKIIEYDGHSNEEKWERIRCFISSKVNKNISNI